LNRNSDRRQRSKSSPVAEDLNSLNARRGYVCYRWLQEAPSLQRLDPLVKNTNKLLVLFGQDPSIQKLCDTDVLPTDFVRVLSMFVAAVDDAIEEVF
jgi:hypothetical protein